MHMRRGELKTVMKYLLAFFFVAAGLNHFWEPEFYMRIMPPYIPWHRELVLLSGVLEVALGVLLLIPKYTRWAAWGIILLLLAVYPANIHMAVNYDLYPKFPLWFHWLRLPLQFVFIAWAWWFTRDAEYQRAAP
jgi:uncharacterized membrane protein